MTLPLGAPTTGLGRMGSLLPPVALMVPFPLQCHLWVKPLFFLSCHKPGRVLGSCVWSGPGTEMEKRLVLPGQAEIRKRLLANTRPRQSLKNGPRKREGPAASWPPTPAWWGELNTQG